MFKQKDDKDATRDKYATILQGYGFSPPLADMVAEAVAYHPGHEREALRSIGASPGLMSASLAVLGVDST